MRGDIWLCAVILTMALLYAIIARFNCDEKTTHIPLLVSIAFTALTALDYIARIYEVVKHANQGL